MRLFGQGDRLFGRDSECSRLDGLLRRARGGRSAALVLRGEAGVGKTALLRYAVSTTPATLSISGIESEADFPYAGLHRLLIPVLPYRDQLPGSPMTGAGTAAPPRRGTATRWTPTPTTWPYS